MSVSLVASSSSALAQQEEGPDQVYFEETGHYLGGAFLDFWRAYGGIQTFGYPISPQIEQDGITVQYFERHVLEYHPDNPDDYQVLLRRVGADSRDVRRLDDNDPFQPGEETDSGRYFEATGQTMQGDFLEYWEENGGTRVFGYPISSEFSLNGIMVQFTERAVFEYHPDNPDEWQVLFEHLGADAADRDDIDTEPREHDGATPQYDEDLWQVVQPEYSAPTQFRIPKIGVSAPVEHVGRTAAGNMQAPVGWHNTAWYELGATPGEPGNAVIAGHYDAPGGVPATFWDLGLMAPGDRVSVVTESGEELVFEVTEVESFYVGNEPTGKIFGSADEANLNLITCAGSWNTSIGMYDQRLVVYTTLVS